MNANDKFRFCKGMVEKLPESKEESLIFQVR